MAKSSVRNEKLVEMALLFLWGEVCGEAMPEDLLNVAHKPVSILPKLIYNNISPLM